DPGRHFDPQFKGDWSPDMAITHNYPHHLTVIRREIVERAGRLRPDFNGAQDIDLFLRCFELIDRRDVLHVPFLGYHWRAHAESTATRGDQKGYLFDAARRGIAEAVARRGLRAEPVLPDFARHHALCLHQLKWSPDILRENPVTIVIPTKNRHDLLHTCLDSLARTTPKHSVKVIVVDDNSDDPATLAYLRAQPSRADLRVEVLTAPPAAGGFNYSRLVNLGTARADTPLVLHLNNDVTALEPGWLEDMAGWIGVPGVGVVGARLLYPDGTLNHAGIALCRDDGLAHVLFEHEPRDEFGALFLPHAARNVTAVTGACLLTRTALYHELGGFDETELPVAYNDVDYCLRAADAEQRCVYTPQATLQHVGSASRGHAYAEREHLAYIARHGARREHFVNAALSFPPRNLPLNPYHHCYADTPRHFRALLVTHNIKLEGAPIFLIELARHLASQPGAQITIAALEDGPLRARFTAAGLKVELWRAPDFSAARSPAELQKLLADFARTRVWDDAEVIVGNTLLTWWTVPLAGQLQRPSALYLHESRPVDRFFADTLPAPLHAAAAEALTLATRVVFTAHSTHAIHEPHNHHDNYRLLPSWVDFDRIDAFSAAHTPADLRRQHGLDPDAVIVTNIGSVCERKGQHIFIRAIELLRAELPARFPGKKIQWVIVGARDGLYMETLREDIELMGLRESVMIFPETPAIYDFYRLSDLLVCTSFEESFPRVILEAMVFGNRIVSTDVNGIAEMLTNTDEALLVPAGDQHKLAAALKSALDAHFAGDRKMLSMARARAARDYHHARILPRHTAMIREAWLG
ncbi:MAG: glycosyltransferase, partial [Opitutaceae bacterium]|nr:glycosyltransferase [Opitutaceae bacterium]